MILLLAAATAAPPAPLPLESEARRVIEWQLRSPPREGDLTRLSPDEAEAIRQRYLQSIGQRLDWVQDDRHDPNR